MKTFEIMFSDLTEEAQKRFLEFQEIDCAEDGNYDKTPIACMDLEEEDSEVGGNAFTFTKKEVERILFDNIPPDTE